MTNPKKKLMLEFGRDNIDLVLNISIKRRVAWIVFTVIICIFILIASSLQEDVRDLVLQALLWTLQNILNSNGVKAKWEKEPPMIETDVKTILILILVAFTIGVMMGVSLTRPRIN